jgi:serine/threonine protein kinase
MQICLTVTEGPHQGQVFSFAGHDTFLVGRSKHAHFRLPLKDKYFSRIHFLVEVNPPSCRVVDMGSRNGTYVNAKKVAAMDLKDGDLITAGHTVFQIGLVEDPAGAAAQLPKQAAGTTPPTAQTMAAPPIKGYQTMRELGRGNLGVVHLARRLVDNTLVALKTIVPATAPSPAQLQRFLDDAASLQSLDHPGIVRCLDLGESGGRLFFAMEYVQGTDAAQLVEKHGPLPIRTAVGMVVQVLKALEFAHGLEFVHRDIKPSNLLLAQGEHGAEVKLADFGLARVYQSSQLSGLTMTAISAGSAAFMAPELLTRYREAKPPADQYATAATLYFLLTGQHVHNLARESHLQFSKILSQSPVPIRKRREEIAEALAKVIHKALARQPQNRFAHVKDFRKALLHAT